MRALVCLGVLVLAAGCGGAAQAPRPDLQRVLDGLVTGPHRITPGATAYVSGPHGAWLGSAGWANVTRQVRMPADARMRLESVSKLWTAIDFWLAAVHDPALHARLVRLADEYTRNPAAQHSPMLEIRTAAALPLLAEPGAHYHYSNIGYELAGVIAERAAGAPLAELYGRFIIRPLGLASAAYAPGGRIDGPHSVGYTVRRGGKVVAATAWGTGGLAAQGGIVSNAQDEARFLVTLMRGKLLPPPMLRELKTPSEASGSYGLGTAVTDACTGKIYTHNGGGLAWSSSVAVTGDGSRVAVLLLNGRTWEDSGDTDYPAALRKLFCSV